MKKIHYLFCIAVLAVFVFHSCASVPWSESAERVPSDAHLPVTASIRAPAGSAAIEPAANVAQAGISPPETPVIIPVPEYIMGKGLIEQKDMAAFLLNINPEAKNDFVESLSLIYIEEAAAEGVNHDAAFAQMCLETGYLRFGGLVTPEMNNFCGLGSVGPGQKGESFPDPRTGVRAHIQHLKAYATDAPLNQELVDPRYFWVRYGSSPALKGLSGTWAQDKQYAEKLNNILERLYNFSLRD